MPRVLTICHPLEGIGRTTLTVQLAAAAAAQGLSVLVIDADPAAGASCRDAAKISETHEYVSYPGEHLNP